MKILQIIKKLFKNVEIGKLTLWLIIIGLLLFIVARLVLNQFDLQSKGGQLLIAIIIVVIYVLLLAMYKIFKYMVNKTASVQIAKQAEGEEQVEENNSERDHLLAYRYYIRHKLNVNRWLPLSVQHLLQRKMVFLFFGNNPALDDYLTEQSWRLLDNPQQFALQVWTKQRYTIINLTADVKDCNIALSWLARYSLLRKLSGIFFISSAEKLITLNGCKEYQQQQQQQIQHLQYYRGFKKCPSNLLIVGIEQLTGATEFANIIPLTDTIPQNSEATPALLSYYQSTVMQYFKQNVDAIENARLQLFMFSLRAIFNNINKTQLNQQQNCTLLTQRVIL